MVLGYTIARGFAFDVTFIHNSPSRPVPGPQAWTCCVHGCRKIA